MPKNLKSNWIPIVKDKTGLPDKFRQALDQINDFIRASNASLGKAPAT